MALSTVLFPAVEAGWLPVVLDGGIDLAAVAGVASIVPASAAQLDTEAGLVVDLSRVDFIGSTGPGALISARDQLKAASRDLILRYPSATVRWLLNLFGVPEIGFEPDNQPHRLVAC